MKRSIPIRCHCPAACKGRGDAGAYAVHADANPKTVYRWVERGTITKARDGHIDFAAADAARGGAIATAAVAPAHDGDDSAPMTYAQAQARNEAAKARLNELKAAQLAGELVPLDALILLLADIIRTFRGRMDALPDALAKDLAAETDEHVVRTRLAAECNAALAELAETMTRKGDEMTAKRTEVT